ncbi:MAG TPA: ribosome biogenesis GTPase Der [Acidimicrobiales bacterium]|jgi:GTP-binding protein|nr:ribosome biogenesis GTPase Der [Actinomycetes bacterium]MDP6104854.1 ribosome biogenesis GTPase Der [Acidimicrobiales bacterium]MDP6241009.1 ribosome biogenesis GTPase Der [Acidimicrobiales bacterium]MDP7125713.1 ribosome biogenesis GTPase Der [Acidimicrobiales bacterium]MDP7353135.1 ribosome biogenesis GTPase Der [Acidimicrobiales bacterium]|tara:strand:- start:2502 stop:3812 length:1311 start_codon:yes stop_codon:yes gene_type:complete
MTPVVAIVGRPNVGKSTLLNRIIGRREAIVEERPGVTRDRKEVDAAWQGRPFTLVDTGGWLTGGDSLDEQVSRQSEKAIADADVVLFVVDATVGVTEDDDRVAALLRGRADSVIVVANKVDDRVHEAASWELLSLGLGDPASVSALHGRGTGDLLDRLVGLFSEEADEGAPVGEEEQAAPRVLGVSIVGRPNVGKSTLFNRLIGEERAVVHDRPGTTRDSVDTIVETGHGPVRFIDTAGMRRKARIDEDTEYYSLVRALRSVDTSDVALLVIDSTIGVTHQDQRLAERVDAAGCPIVVLLNKWDLCDTEQRADVTEQVGQRLHFVGDAPVLRISALTGKNVGRLWPALAESIEDYRTRIPTRRVNDVVRAAQSEHPAPAGARVLYATQGATDPPTFTLFANRELPRTWLRYLERRLREDLGLGSTPIKLRVRRRSE